MKSKISVLMVCLVVFSGSALLNAAGRREPEEKTYRRGPAQETGRHRGRDAGKMREKLNLTDQQQVKMKENYRAGIKERKEISRNLSERFDALREVLSADEIDREKADNIIDEISAIQGDLLRRRVRGIYEFRETLTEQQWEKLKERGMMRMLGPERLK